MDLSADYQSTCVMFQILDRRQIYFILAICLKAINHSESKVNCKYHLHRDKKRFLMNDNIKDRVPLRHPSQVYGWLSFSLEDAKCGETALIPQCCCVYQLGVLGCEKKPIWFIVELLQTRWTLMILVGYAGVSALNQGEDMTTITI